MLASVAASTKCAGTPDGRSLVAERMALASQVLATHPAADQRIDRILEGLERSQALDLGCVGERDRDVVEVGSQAIEDGREFGEQPFDAVGDRCTLPVADALPTLYGTRRSRWRRASRAGCG